MSHQGKLMILTGTVGLSALLFAVHRGEQQRALQDVERQQEIELLRQELSAMKNDRASRSQLAEQLVKGRVDRGQPSPGIAEEEAAFADENEADSRGAPDKPEMSDEEMKTLVLASVYSTFDAEQHDATWSRDANRQLTQAVTAGLPKGSRLEKVECRSSLCKVDTHHRDVAEFRAFVDDTMLSRERQVWNGGIYAAVIDQSDQGVVAVTYMAKEGQSVPLPEI